MGELRDRFQARRQTRVGHVDPVTKTHLVDTFRERTDDAQYVGRDERVWLYRVFTNVPLKYEPEKTLLDHGRGITNLLAELGGGSIPKPPLLNAPPDGFYRRLHILTVRWYERPTAPAGTRTRAHTNLLNRQILNFTSPSQLLFIGVELRDMAGIAKRRKATWLDVAEDLINRAFDDRPADFDRYAADRDWVHQIMVRNGCRTPTHDERRQLEAWFNHGSHTSPEIAVPKEPPADYLLIDRTDRLEFAALERFTTPMMKPPLQEWIADTMDHPDGPAVVSIRGELQPAADTRKVLRKSVRKRRLEDEERQRAGQDERVEESIEAEMTRFAEAKLAMSDAPATLRNVSIVFGHRADGTIPTESYIDHLRQSYGIEVTPLVHRQLWALEETLPCAQKRANPFPQAQLLDMLGYAGLGMFTNVGDASGAMIGRGLPDGVPVYHDPFEASRSGPTGMLVAGISGSGKTFFSQNVAYQMALAGWPVIFINPKTDSLFSMVELMQRSGVESEWVPISKLTQTGGQGAYDPFRYAPSPESAAAITANLITTVLDEWPLKQRNALRHGLLMGARAGARCVGQALDFVDRDTRDEVVQQAESTPLFGLFIGMEPRDRLSRGLLDTPDQGRFMLVEFDVDLNLPTELKQGRYSDPERIALAAIRAVTSASIGMLADMQGGLMVMDEAHTVLGHPDTVQIIGDLMRKARSLNIAQIYATQLVSDLLNVGGTGSSLESHISTVLALKMTDEKEAAAALKLVGYDPTPAYIAWMREFGPERTDAGQRPAYGFYRDLKGRRTLVSLGPVSKEFERAASTNIDDKIARQRARELGVEGDGRLFDPTVEMPVST